MIEIHRCTAFSFFYKMEDGLRSSRRSWTFQALPAHRCAWLTHLNLPVEWTFFGLEMELYPLSMPSPALSCRRIPPLQALFGCDCVEDFPLRGVDEDPV